MSEKTKNYVIRGDGFEAFCLDASFKLRADGTESEYGGFISDGIKLLAMRNSYACAQVAVRATSDSRLAVTFGLDAPESTSAKYPTDCFSVFAEKYIYVDKNWQRNGFAPDWYPDALIPMDAAAEYGENLIESGAVRSFWLEFRIPVWLPAGTYRGAVRLNADKVFSGKTSLNIPVSIEVLSAVLPDETGVKSLFHTNAEYMKRYERGNESAMYDKYINYLMAHGIAQTNLTAGNGPKVGTEEWCDKVLALARNGLTTIGVPSGETVKDGFATYDDGSLVKTVFALAKKSVESGFNLIERCAFYDWKIDEPFCVRYADGQVESAIERFRECMDKVTALCESNLLFDSDFGREVIGSVQSLPHIVTDYYEKPYFPSFEKRDKNGNPYKYDVRKVTLCPKYDGYDSPQMRAQYDNGSERWWYGCNTPNTPFPGYHIDEPLFTPRLVGWLQSLYGVTGNLYWANNYYSECNRTGKSLFVEDPYQTAHRGSGANGEGAILYPGSRFNVDGPIGCIRLKSIRDGNRDYDLFEMTKSAYAMRGRSFGPIFAHTLSAVVDEMKTDAFSRDFEAVRTSLYRLCEAALGAPALTVNVSKADGRISFRFEADEKFAVYCNGRAIGRGPFGVYECSVRTLHRGWAEFELRGDGTVYPLPLYIGGGLHVLLRETAYRNGKIRCEKGSMKLNESDIFREILVSCESGGSCSCELPAKAGCGEELGLELRSEKDVELKITLTGKGTESFTVMLKGGDWKRVSYIPTHTAALYDRLTISSERPFEIGFGEVYVTN